MTAVVVDPSWVTLTLDTTPPAVKVQAETEVDPPAGWDVVFVANEDIGGAKVALTDAYGTVTPVGWEQTDQRTLRVVIPSQAVSGGPAVLRAEVWDDVCNAVTVETKVWVRRDALFTGYLTVEHAFDVVLLLDHAYEVESEIVRPFEVRMEMDDA